MLIDPILAKFSPDVRNSDAMRVLIALHQTFAGQLQSTQEQLKKALEKIKILEDEIAKLRKTPK